MQGSNYCNVQTTGAVYADSVQLYTQISNEYAIS